MSFEFAGQRVEMKGGKRLPRAFLEKKKGELEKKIDALRDRVHAEERREVMSVLAKIWDGRIRDLPKEDPDYDRRVDQADHPASDSHNKGLYG